MGTRYRIAVVLSCLIFWVPGVWATDPEGQFALDWNLQGTVSVPVDPFWNTYANVAATVPPFATVRLGLEQSSRWKVYAEIGLKQQFTGWEATNLPIPVPSIPRAPVDYHVIQQGYLWYNFDPLQVSLGREGLHWGPPGHSFIVSDAIPFLDGFQVTLPMGDFTLRYAATSPETRKSGQVNFDTATYFVLHRLEWSHSGVTIAFTEQALLDRNGDTEGGGATAKAVYPLTDFFPVFLFHQGEIMPFNTSMTLDFDWQVSNEWRLWLQLASDEFDSSVFGIPDTPTPTINGYLAGLSFVSGPVTWNLGVGTNHYLWGNFDDNSFLARAIYRVLLDSGLQELYLTSPYGPGTNWATTDFTWNTRSWSVSGRAEVWTTLPGITLHIPYDSPEPDPLAFDLHARVSAEATIRLGDFALSTGPVFLLSKLSVTPQWKASLKTTWGSMP
jgi:hypothetical protein